MKTYQFADLLLALAQALRRGPNLDVSPSDVDEWFSPRPRTSSEIAVNLATLSALARINRSEWMRFVNDYGIPIDFRERDASRDILGKLLRYLEEHPQERSRLERRSVSNSAKASPELMKALSFLLKDTRSEP